MPGARANRLLSPDPPDGFTYVADFLSEEEEQAVISEIESYPFHEVRMRGQVARRTVLHFGWDYDYEGWQIEPAAPPPQAVRDLADRAAALAGVAPEALEQFLIARYPPGATIGWHRDAPMFGSPVVGLSLAAECTMRFRRPVRSGERKSVPGSAAHETWSATLSPRSLYILAGAARTQWQHSIPPTRELRYSITMRTVRRRAAAP